MGGAAGVAEMLVQSHAGEMHLLLALSLAWSEGAVEGLRARTGFDIDLAWADGTLTEATIRASADGPCTVRTAVPVTVTNESGQRVEVRRPGEALTVFQAAAGQSYVLRPQAE